MSVTWSSVSVPATALPGVVEPLSTPRAWRMSTGVGGVFRTKVKLRSSKTVISTGTMVPFWASVAALYALQKSMIATPCGPSAVPTGGAGVAAPAGIWILTTAATRLLAMRLLPASSVGAPRLQLGDLGELELDRGLPAKDVHEDLDLELVLVDLGDLAGEVGEGTLAHPDALPYLVLQLRALAPLGALGLGLVGHRQGGLDVLSRERDRLAGGAHEPGHARG